MIHEDPHIDCPACGETVQQVVSATLSLALWQHWNWTCKANRAASPPVQAQAIKDERDWIRTKFKIPLDAPIGDVYGLMHNLEAQAHGYVTYIEAFKCDDKQGEIARLTVENAALRDKLAALPPAQGWHAEKDQ